MFSSSFQEVRPSLNGCSDGTSNCQIVALTLEAVFPLFIYKREGSVATLIAEIGGVISLVFSLFYSIILGYRVIMYLIFDKNRLEMIKGVNRPTDPQRLFIGRRAQTAQSPPEILSESSNKDTYPTQGSQIEDSWKSTIVNL